MPNFDKPRGLSRTFRLTPQIISREIRAARKLGQRITITDTGCPGLRLIIGPRSATWSITARPRGSDAAGKRPALKSVTLGDATDIDPEAARKAARAIKQHIALGRDPVGERREQRRREVLAIRDDADRAAADVEMLRHILNPTSPTKSGKSALIFNFAVLTNATLTQCAEAFIHHGAGGARLHRYQTASNLRLALAEMNAADLKPRELGRHHVRALVDLHSRAGRPAVARHRHSAVARLFKWMMDVAAVENDPTNRVQMPPPPSPRSNVPTAVSIKALWDAAERLPPARSTFVRLMLLLPLRRQEMANLRVGNILIDGFGMEIRLQPDQTKNRKPFTMPLVGAAAAIVTELLEKSGSPESSLLRLAGPSIEFRDWTRLARQIECKAGLHFNWHDTRRCFASEMGEHAVANFGLIDGLLNHQRSASMGGVARSYHHATDRSAKAAAMLAWDNIMRHAAEHGVWPREMPATDNVVPLKPVAS